MAPKNPYAAKKAMASSPQTSNTQPTAASSKSSSSSHPRALQAVEIGTSASFSQAFSSIDDTTHFQKEISDKSTGAASTSWAAQRAFDEAAASTSSSQPLDDANQPAASTTSARDHHALLQQPHVLYVSTKQRGNGVLKFIRNVPMQYATMVPDFLLQTSRCALFLSCKYHSLHPNYIHRRIAELKTDFVLRILLVLVDVDDNANTLLQLNRLAVQNNLTLILAWTEEEAARYLETYKALDGKDASSIQKREQTNFADQVADVLSTVRSVNKTDAAQLLSQFGSLKGAMHASMDELGLCQGLGEKKVRRLHDAFHKPFSRLKSKRRREEKRRIQEQCAGAEGQTMLDEFDETKADDVQANPLDNSKSEVAQDDARRETNTADP